MSVVRCQGCRAYKAPTDMRKVGLGYVCDAACIDLVRQRARDKHERREESRNRRSYRGAPAGPRRRAQQRDGHLCRWCGTGALLAVHHIVYRSQGGGHELSNLITLCDPCHAKAHSNKGRWQPVLLETVRLTELGVFLTVGEVEARMTRESA